MNTVSKVGDTVRLPCRAQGRPRPRIVWDRIIKSREEKSVPTINTRLKRDDLGNVTRPKREASQPYERPYESELSGTLEEFEQIMRDEGVNNDEDPIYVRRKRGLPSSSSTVTPISNYLEVADSGELLLRDVTVNDQGWYVCAAINEAGSVVKRVFVRISSPDDRGDDDLHDEIAHTPEPHGSYWGSEDYIMISALVPTSSSTLDVYWENSEHLEDMPVTVYFRIVPLIPENKNDVAPRGAFKGQSTTLFTKEHTLNDLKPFTDYEVFVAVPKGIGRIISNIRKRKTMPSAPSAPPTDIKVGIINTTAAFVRWSPPPPHLLNGELTGYKVSSVFV